MLTGMDVYVLFVEDERKEDEQQTTRSSHLAGLLFVRVN